MKKPIRMYLNCLLDQINTEMIMPQNPGFNTGKKFYKINISSRRWLLHEDVSSNCNDKTTGVYTFWNFNSAIEIAKKYKSEFVQAGLEPPRLVVLGFNSLQDSMPSVSVVE